MFIKAEPTELLCLDGRHLLMQFSFSQKYLSMFRVPKYTRVLAKDSVFSREQRKAREGRDAEVIITKSCPTKLNFKLPPSYVLEDPVFQAREKYNSQQEISDYVMLRFRLHERQNLHEKTKRQTLDFLRLMLSYAWDIRAYKNNVSTKSDTFFSINIENLQMDNIAQRTLRFQQDKLLLY
jgi:hypothetical protein